MEKDKVGKPMPIGARGEQLPKAGPNAEPGSTSAAVAPGTAIPTGEASPGTGPGRPANQVNARDEAEKALGVNPDTIGGTEASAEALRQTGHGKSLGDVPGQGLDGTLAKPGDSQDAGVQPEGQPGDLPDGDRDVHGQDGIVDSALDKDVSSVETEDDEDETTTY